MSGYNVSSGSTPTDLAAPAPTQRTGRKSKVKGPKVTHGTAGKLMTDCGMTFDAYIFSFKDGFSVCGTCLCLGSHFQVRDEHESEVNEVTVCRVLYCGCSDVNVAQCTILICS